MNDVPGQPEAKTGPDIPDDRNEMTFVGRLMGKMSVKKVADCAQR